MQEENQNIDKEFIQEKEEVELIKEETNPVNKKMTILNFILIIIIFVGLLIYMINVDGIENIVDLLHKVDYRWVFAGVICG